jgi:putative hydrolase of the HAD superfamily
MITPEPGIFRLSMGIVQARPEVCFYFDDRAILVDAAAKRGMASYQQKSFKATKAILEGIV